MATIQEFIHYCSGPNACGQVIANEDGVAKLVRRYAVLHDGKIRIVVMTPEEAQEFIAKRGWTVAAS